MEKKTCTEKVCQKCGWCCTNLGISVDISKEEDENIKRMVFEKAGVIYLRPINKFFLSFTPKKADKLKAIAKKRNLKVDIRPNKLIYDQNTDKVIIYDYYLNHEICPFYNKEKKSCTIYEDRPESCKKFPNIDSSYSKEIAKFVKKNKIEFKDTTYEEAIKKCKSFCKISS